MMVNEHTDPETWQHENVDALPDVLKETLPPSREVSALPHPRALAFLGDSVFELKLRELAVQQGFNQSDDLHRYTTKRVNAVAQAALLQHIKPFLLHEELEIVRQARNMAVGSTRRSDQTTYRQATGFEALIGYLHLTHRVRLEQLWQDCMVPYLLEEQPLNPKK